VKLFPSLKKKVIQLDAENKTLELKLRKAKEENITLGNLNEDLESKYEKILKELFEKANDS
jgi:hypothetical protein